MNHDDIRKIDRVLSALLTLLACAVMALAYHILN